MIYICRLSTVYCRGLYIGGSPNVLIKSILWLNTKVVCKTVFFFWPKTKCTVPVYRFKSNVVDRNRLKTGIFVLYTIPIQISIKY